VRISICRALRHCARLSTLTWFPVVSRDLSHHMLSSFNEMRHPFQPPGPSRYINSNLEDHRHQWPEPQDPKLLRLFLSAFHTPRASSAARHRYRAWLSSPDINKKASLSDTAIVPSDQQGDTVICHSDVAIRIVSIGRILFQFRSPRSYILQRRDGHPKDRGRQATQQPNSGARDCNIQLE
jgi:hypothetical protein